ncbi:methyltransferase domain-containing protein [Micromonospora saelicesensis]|uniref:methyltransferase domain-containing protein n=1 Tax=Micromonospora saelicesensis TaxID=285676 RepID=UPI003CEED105
MKCRSCRADLSEPILDLGFAPPSNQYLSKSELDKPEAYLPIRARFCDRCKLMQMEDYSLPQELFTTDYAYRSGVSRSWLEHVAGFATSAVSDLELTPGSLVIEIGCNDGHLLRRFAEQGIGCLGIEPAEEAAEAAREHGIDVVVDFFSTGMAASLAGRGVFADLVVANNVFAHVPDINDFAEGLQIVLGPDGVVVLEFPHVQNLLHHAQFDTIYHEHYSYLSLTSASQVLRHAGLEVFDVEKISTHGGSLRVFASHRGSRPVRPEVGTLLRSELDAGLGDRPVYAALQPAAERIKDDLLRFLLDAKRDGRRVAAYGAAAKGNTLLNFAGVKPDLLPVVFDAAPSKQGKYLPGSHVPIRPPSAIETGAWDSILILPWNIAQEIVGQLRPLLGKEVDFVVAVPDLTIL